MFNQFSLEDLCITKKPKKQQIPKYLHYNTIRGYFKELEGEGHLDVGNETDIFYLHYVYVSRINDVPVAHQNAHNNHKISTEVSATIHSCFMQMITWDNFLPLLTTTVSVQWDKACLFNLVIYLSLLSHKQDARLQKKSLCSLYNRPTKAIKYARYTCLEVVNFVGTTLQQSSSHWLQLRLIIIDWYVGLWNTNNYVTACLVFSICTV